MGGRSRPRARRRLAPAALAAVAGGAALAGLLAGDRGGERPDRRAGHGAASAPGSPRTATAPAAAPLAGSGRGPAGPSLPAGARVLVPDGAAEALTAYAGALAWSSGSARDGYRLVVRLGGVPQRVPLPASRVPLDPDLGPAALGGATLVFARCARGDCDLETIDPGRGLGERLTDASSDACFERAPSVWRERVAFARVARPGPLGAGCRAGLYVMGPGGRIRRLGAAAPVATDLRGSAVVAAYRVARGARIVLWDAERGGRRLLARGRTARGGGDEVRDPVLDDGRAWWLHEAGTAPPRVVGVAVGRGRRGGGRGAAARTAAWPIDSFAVDGGRVLVTGPGGVLRVPVRGVSRR